VRAGVTRQAAGQLLAEIESRGYVALSPDPDDARATLVTFSARGRKLLATVLELVEEFEGGIERSLPRGDFQTILQGLARIADDLDPGGALGHGDRTPD
jgi:DNA-binding MarR family transcriptional regulator